MIQLPLPCRPPNPHPPKMPAWLNGILLVLSGFWVLEAALFLLSYRAFGRS